MANKVTLALLSMILSTTTPLIMRNNALMTKMVSRFQGKENNRPPRDYRTQGHEIQERPQEIYDGRPQTTLEDNIQEQGPGHVLSLMQNVLCKNFPSVPCNLITKDEKLRNLIQKSILQLKYKKMAMERSTQPPDTLLTLFPKINNEDLNFLQTNNKGYYNEMKAKKQKRKSTPQKKNYWSPEGKNISKTSIMNGRKKIRKFYPHKIKYKDKRDMNDYSDDKFSVSVETPLDHSPNVKIKHFSYKSDPADPPVWRIDYMKHGEPSLNMFGYDDGLKGKLIKTGPNVIVDDNIIEQAVRRDVLHPDVYIKTNYPRKSHKDSEDMD